MSVGQLVRRHTSLISSYAAAVNLAPIGKLKPARAIAGGPGHRWVVADQSLSIWTIFAETETEEKEMSGPLSYEMETLAGEKVALAKYKGNVVLMVNVASKCGLTPQYEQLQALHKTYADQGLSVVGFPCNQFGGQEPGSAEDIQEFCATKYSVEFDMMAKIDVNGDGACDLYKHLTTLETEPQAAGDIGWNFEKFLIDRTGKVINRFSPRVSPDDAEVIKAIKTALAATP